MQSELTSWKSLEIYLYFIYYENERDELKIKLSFSEILYLSCNAHTLTGGGVH